MAFGINLDLDAVAAALTGWCARQRPDSRRVEVADVRVPEGAGSSADTILFDLVDGDRHEPLAARLAPSVRMFRDYDLLAQFRVLQALHDEGTVPVPRPWRYEDDPAILGGPFFVMQRLPGRAPRDAPPYTAEGWVQDLAPEQRRTMWDNALETLVSVHELDHRSLGLDFLDRADWGGDVIERRMTYWRRNLDWATGDESNPIAEAGIAWLREHRPTEVGDAVLAWGDARVGNMLFADDLSVTAVLDWEAQIIGTREMDLGWWLFMQRHHTSAIGVPLPEGIPDRDETLARYEMLSGHRLQDMRYFEVLAATGCAALYHRTGTIMVETGLLPPDSPIKLNNPATQMLAELLGLPQPDGSQHSYLDRR